MNKLLLTAPALAGSLLLGAGTTTSFAGPVAEAFCGPQPTNGCEVGGEQKVFLDNGKNQTVVTGNVGANNKGPAFTATSDNGMMLTITLDSGGGWSNITPGGKANFFNGLDIKIPGYEFTGLIFGAQLHPTANPLDTFTVQGFDGAHISQGAAHTDSDQPDQDREYSIRITGGLFDEVDIFSQLGFDEIKQIEVSGLCQIPVGSVTCVPVIIDTPEPASLVILGVGLLGLGYVSRRRT